MTRFATALIVATFAATASFADAHNAALIDQINVYSEQHSLGIDASTLSDTQLASIQAILDGSDSANDKKAAIMGIINN